MDILLFIVSNRKEQQYHMQVLEVYKHKTWIIHTNFFIIFTYLDRIFLSTREHIATWNNILLRNNSNAFVFG